MKKIITVLLLIWTLFLTACPKEDAVRTGGKLVNQATGAIVKTRDAIIRSEAAGNISREKRDELVLITLNLFQGNKAVNDALLALDASPEKGDLRAINLLFNEKVITPFFDLLEKVKILSGPARDDIMFALSAVKTAILAISIKFDEQFSGNSKILRRLEHAG